jgi:hypothetical protein
MAVTLHLEDMAAAILCQLCFPTVTLHPCGSHLRIYNKEVVDCRKLKQPSDQPPALFAGWFLSSTYLMLALCSLDCQLNQPVQTVWLERPSVPLVAMCSAAP